jgi:outer membrane protein TolC
MNHIKQKLLTALVLSLTAAASWTQTPDAAAPHNLSADEAAEQALKTHVDIQRSSLSLEQASRSYRHAWNSFLPSVSADGTANEQQTLPGNTVSSDNTVITAGASASLKIDAGIGAKIAGLKTAYKSGKASYEDTVRSVECTVRKAYYALLYSNEKVNTSKASLDSYQRQYDQTKEKRDRGVVPELDLLSAQVNLETAKTDLESAKSSYENSLREFLNTIGAEYDENIVLTDSLDYADKVGNIDSSVLDGCIEKSSDVITLENKITAAEQSRDQAFCSSFLPSLTAGAGVYPGCCTLNNATDTKTSSPYWNISLGVSLPVDSWIPGSQAHDTVSKLDDTVKDLNLQLEDTKKNVHTNAVKLLRTVEQSQTAVAARKLNVALAKKSYEMTEEAYKRGTKDLLTLQSALDTYYSAQLQLRSEQYTLISSVLNLENALGCSAGTFFTNTDVKGETK